MHVIALPGPGGPGPGIFLAQLSRVQNYIDARSHPQSDRDDVQTLLNLGPGCHEPQCQAAGLPSTRPVVRRT